MLAERIQRLIERHPTFAYRRLWGGTTVAAGGEPSDTAAVRGNAGEDRDAAVAGGMRRGQSGAIFDDGAGLAEKCLPMCPRKQSFPAVAYSPAAKLVPFGAAGNTVDQGRLKSLQKEVVRSTEEPEGESQNGNPCLTKT